MTKREAAIITAYTGFLIGKFEDAHKYIEEIVGRPVFTHEMGDADFMARVQELSKNDFIFIGVES